MSAPEASAPEAPAHDRSAPEAPAHDRSAPEAPAHDRSAPEAPSPAGSGSEAAQEGAHAPPKSVSPALGVLAALGGAVAVAIGAILVLGPPRSVERDRLPASSAASSSTARAFQPSALPSLEPMPDVEPEGSPGGVPLDILKTSTVVAASWAPGLALIHSTIRGGWEDRRAQIRDRTNGDVRGYAIGDLLPHGSLLVGISTGTADILVGDAHLVRLFEDGRVTPLEDFTLAFQPQALKPVKHADDDDRDRVLLAIHDARSDDPTVVQAAIDDLIASGDPAIDSLMSYVDSALPVFPQRYGFPSAGTRRFRPRALGEVIMIVLEQITGQTFGHLKETSTAEERAAIAKRWRRWWGEE